MSIDLRFSDVDPPETDPARIIYTDIVGLPNPMYLGLICRAFNDDSVTLYMQLEGTHANWTFTSTNLGALGAGVDSWYRINQFGYRARPSSETTEILSITLNAYTDAGYSNLKWTTTRNISIFMLKSDDLTWDIDEYDNFDDGTVQGWASGSTPPSPTFGVATDYVLSPSYSLKTYFRPNAQSASIWLYKSFTTANKDLLFGVANVRFDQAAGSGPPLTFQIQIDGETVISLPNVTLDKWYHFVFPLPRDSTVEIKLLFYGWTYSWPWWLYEWLDDFRIISKDQERLPITDLTGTNGIAFYWWGTGDDPEIRVDFILESPTGFWMSSFYDGPARWRLVFLPWGSFTWVSLPAPDLDPHRHGFNEPDRSQINGFSWTLHTPGLRRIDFIYAPVGLGGDLLGAFIIRHSTWKRLLGEFIPRRSASVTLPPGEFIARQADLAELPAEFESGQGRVNLLGQFDVGQDSADLPSGFLIRTSTSEDLPAGFIIYETEMEDFEDVTLVDHYQHAAGTGYRDTNFPHTGTWSWRTPQGSTDTFDLSDGQPLIGVKIEAWTTYGNGTRKFELLDNDSIVVATLTWSVSEYTLRTIEYIGSVRYLKITCPAGGSSGLWTDDITIHWATQIPTTRNLKAGFTVNHP